MGPDRQFARLIAAMIVMIVASFVPCAAQAHAGHAHQARPQDAVAQMAPGPSVNPTTPDVAAGPRALRVATAAPRGGATSVLRDIVRATAASLRSDERAGACCRGSCTGSCCGDMVCCASGILPGPAVLVVPSFLPVSMTAQDVADRVGAGPEALPKPPRTLA